MLLIILYIIDYYSFSSLPLTIFAMCCLCGALLSTACLLHFLISPPDHRSELIGDESALSRPRNYTPSIGLTHRSASGTLRVCGDDGVPIGRTLVVLCGVALVSLVFYAVRCGQRVEILPGQDKLVGPYALQGYFLGGASVRRIDGGDDLSAFLLDHKPPLTGPTRCGRFNSTLRELRRGYYEYDALALNAGATGEATLWVEPSDKASACELDLYIYSGDRPRKDDNGRLTTPLAQAKAKLGHPATLAFSGGRRTVTYFNNHDGVTRAFARATLAFCEPTYDLRAGASVSRVSSAHVLLGVGAGAVFGVVLGAAVGCEVGGGAGAAIGAAAGFVVGMPAGAIAGSGVRTAAGTLDSCAGAPCELGGPLASSHTAGAVALVLLAPRATAPVEVQIRWKPRWGVMFAVAALPSLVALGASVAHAVRLRLTRRPRRLRGARATERDPLVARRVDARTGSLNAVAVPTTTAAGEEIERTLSLAEPWGIEISHDNLEVLGLVPGQQASRELPPALVAMYATPDELVGVHRTSSAGARSRIVAVDRRLVRNHAELIAHCDQARRDGRTLVALRFTNSPVDRDNMRDNASAA